MFRFIKELVDKTTLTTFTSGLLAFITFFTPALVIMEVAQRNNFSQELVVSWLFGCFFFGGLIGLIIAWRYKQPINGAMSIPAAVFLGGALQNIPLEQAIFGYFISGFLICMIGLLKLYDKIMKWIKLEIIMAMFAGTMIHYAVNVIIITYLDYLLYGGLAILTYFLALKFSKTIPPSIIVIIIVTIALGINRELPVNLFTQNTWVNPKIMLWDPTWQVIFTISIPLVIIVFSSELTIGISILRSEKYHPPIDKMTIFSGLGIILASFFGSHNITTSGVPISILADPSTGPKSIRYIAALWTGIFTLTFGLFANLIYLIVTIYPQKILQIFVGLLLIPILMKALYQAFGTGNFRYGTFVAFVLAISNISILGIGSAFWAILFGMIISFIFERGDFQI